MYTVSNHKGVLADHQYTGSRDESTQVVEDHNKDPELTIPPPPDCSCWTDPRYGNTGIGNSCYPLSYWVIIALTAVTTVVIYSNYWCAGR